MHPASLTTDDDISLKQPGTRSITTVFGACHLSQINLIEAEVDTRLWTVGNFAIIDSSILWFTGAVA